MNANDYRAARDLALCGVPLFMAPPDPTARLGYRLPIQWERGARADPSLVDALPEGWALCAVMGHGLDLVDLDPRNSDGTELPALPPALAMAETPSGGRHLFVLSLGLPSLDGVAPGLDYKGGDPTGGGRGFAFIAPTVRIAKTGPSVGLPVAYRWVDPPRAERIGKARQALGGGPPGATFDPLRAAISARREVRATGEARVVPESVAAREWRGALARLEADLRRWAASGWGGEAHAGLLAHTTHLARLWPDEAKEAYQECFAWAGIEPDDADLAKIESALRLNAHLADRVVPDAEMDPGDLFWAGGAPVVPPKAEAPVADPASVEGGPFDFVDPAELERPRVPPQPRWGAFGGSAALFYAEGVHWLQGESESGKSWVALGWALEVLRAGGRVLLVDHEDTRTEVLARLRALGATGADVGRLVYLDGHAVGHADVAAHLATTDRDYDLLVVDGVTSALSSAGLSGRDEQELTRWADQVPRRARASVCVDHVVKSPDERNGMAIGSQAKKSVVTGTSFEVRCTERFGRGRSGALELRVQKDKRGGVRASGRTRWRLRVLCGEDESVRLLAGGALGGAPTDADALFADPEAERRVRAEEIVKALTDNAVDPGGDIDRALIPKARSLWDQDASRDLLRDACRLFKSRAGLTVKLPEGWS